MRVKIFILDSDIGPIKKLIQIRVNKLSCENPTSPNLIFRHASDRFQIRSKNFHCSTSESRFIYGYAIAVRSSRQIAKKLHGEVQFSYMKGLALLSLFEYARLVLDLSDEARKKVLAKTQQLERDLANELVLVGTR